MPKNYSGNGDSRHSRPSRSTLILGQPDTDKDNECLSKSRTGITEMLFCFILSGKSVVIAIFTPHYFEKHMYEESQRIINRPPRTVHPVVCSRMQKNAAIGRRVCFHG